MSLKRQGLLRVKAIEQILEWTKKKTIQKRKQVINVYSSSKDTNGMRNGR